MTDWRDINLDGKVDRWESFLAEEELYEEGKTGNHMSSEFDIEDDDELELFGLDIDELEMMDEDERREALEDAGLDPDDYDFF